jgi:hypothetical protein
MKIAELESLALPVAMEQLYVSSNIHPYGVTYVRSVLNLLPNR